ncbi:MAG: endonuclease/exonuclease/phosphatase family protein [Planctomycetes bacterium]|nr:endonuclease/exonuclease/phosphatase family protein [Planctomycetota bacterium]
MERPRRRWTRLTLGVAVVLVTHAVGATLASGRPATCACAAPAWLPAIAAPPAAVTTDAPLRVVTYNLHSGLGPRLSFGKPREVVEHNLRAIAAAIVAASPGHAPDVVGLNEVDFDSRRSAGIDQAAFLARDLERRTGAPYGVVEGVTWVRETKGFEVRYGNAVLVRHPVVRSEALRFDDMEQPDLPGVRSGLLLDRLVREGRGVVKVTIAAPAGEVDVLVTHLDAFAQAEREAQAAHILRHVAPDRTTVLLGDFNAVPTRLTLGRRFFRDDLTHDLLTSGGLADARLVVAAREEAGDLTRWSTFPADVPEWPLDGVLGSLDLLPARAEVVGTTESDHRGLVVDYHPAGDEAGALRSWHDAVRRRQVAHIEGCGEGEDPHAASLAPGAHDQREHRRRRLLAGSGFADLLTRRAE